VAPFVVFLQLTSTISSTVVLVRILSVGVSHFFLPMLVTASSSLFDFYSTSYFRLPGRHMSDIGMAI
jgi:hypothetical protein